mmetsp:Transcript_64309/g.114266  ORF Transcript_64309/g.114266 Transcript_64309/m.114266 type:complete len:311 (+) Transcript_64309:156-1088(+)
MWTNLIEQGVISVLRFLDPDSIARVFQVSSHWQAQLSAQADVSLWQELCLRSDIQLSDAWMQAILCPEQTFGNDYGSWREFFIEAWEQTASADYSNFVVTWMTWIVAYTSSHGQTIIFVFCPRTGQLFLDYAQTLLVSAKMHVKWRVAKRVASLLRSFPVEEPQQVLAAHDLIEPLEARLMDNPEFALHECNMPLPFQALLKTPLVSELTSSGVGFLLVKLNAYDNWLETISPYNALLRLSLVMQGLYAHEETVKTALGNWDKTTSMNFWPSLSDANWEEVEMLLKHQILNVADIGGSSIPNAQNSTLTS